MTHEITEVIKYCYAGREFMTHKAADKYKVRSGVASKFHELFGTRDVDWSDVTRYLFDNYDMTKTHDEVTGKPLEDPVGEEPEIKVGDHGVMTIEEAQSFTVEPVVEWWVNIAGETMVESVGPEVAVCPHGLEHSCEECNPPKDEPCSTCGGKGLTFNDSNAGRGYCPVCNGTGKEK